MAPPRLASIAESRAAILDGELTVTDLTRGFLARIAEHEAELRGFSLVDEDGALRQAAMMDQSLRTSGKAGHLLGAVVSVKDIVDVAHLPTTCCSHSRLRAVAATDARLVERLRAEGAIVIGKANCHEFAFGGPAFDLPFPPARNPWNADLFPGGSSSGSGVTVAAAFCNASIGTDTAGSIRLPATHCGVTGLKPTYGAVPLAGVAPLAQTMDSAGPLARTVADCRLLFEILGTAPKPASRRWSDGDLSGWRLGILDGTWDFASRFENDVAAEYERVKARLREAGASFVEIDPPSFERIHAAAAIIMMAEVAAGYAGEVRARYAQFGSVFRKRALVGERLTPRHYLQALEERSRIAAAFSALFGEVDAILMPGSFKAAGPLKTVDTFYFLKDPNINAVANLTGCPSLALPTGLTPAGIPTGIQLMGPHHSESALLDAGLGIERLLDFRSTFA